ncbi:MAG: hypothetical protein J6K80_02540 [Oscillospiraceae bacterium]|nr:hypothetical protein [Oscillospiraceae bacterium]
MAFITSNFYSAALGQEVDLEIYLPNDYTNKTSISQPQAVIYFLHGLSRSQKYFKELSATNRYARDNQLAVVYISAPQSWYSDMVHGMKYYTYITEELPKLLKSMYGLEFPREKTFLAGLSMGGYGTWKIGLSRPDMFSAIAPMSAPCDMKTVAEMIKKRKAAGADTSGFTSFFSAFGDDMNIKDEDDIFCLLEKVSELPAEQQPRIRSMCGKQDELISIYKQNVKLDEFAKTLPLADYKFWRWDGAHEYSFWDRAILHAIAFFLENDYDEKEIRKWRCERE